MAATFIPACGVEAGVLGTGGAGKSGGSILHSEALNKASHRYLKLRALEKVCIVFQHARTLGEIITLDDVHWALA